MFHAPSRFPLLCFALSFCLAPITRAQETRATVLGLVTDPTGAAIPAVVVTARSLETSVETKATTNSSGAYEIPYIVQGNYEISVEAPGFRSTPEPVWRSAWARASTSTCEWKSARHRPASR